MDLKSIMMDLMNLLGHQNPKRREKQLYPRKGQKPSVMTANRRLHKKYKAGKIKHKPVGPRMAQPTAKMLEQMKRHR